MTRNSVTEDSSPVAGGGLPSSADPSSKVEFSGIARLCRQISGFCREFRGWPWLIPLLASGVTGVGAFMWLASLPPSPNCDQLSSTLSDAERLYCADQATRQGEAESLSAALELTRNWSRSHPLYAQAQRLTDEWSQSILVVARRKMEQGDLKQAVALADRVPPSSSGYLEAQSLMNQWRENWDQGAEIVQRAQTAIKKQDWKQATEQVRLLVQLGDDYWQQRADKIVAQMAVERESFRTLQQAQFRAGKSTPEDLTAAIQLVSKVDPQQLARDEVEKKIEVWSQDLLDITRNYKDSGLYEQSLAAAQGIPPGSPLSDQALAVAQMGKAEALAAADQVGSYLQALMLARPLSSGKDLLSESETAQVEEWEYKVQNFGQIQLAQVFANVGQPFALQLAVDHAALVADNQPQRVEAQTLIAMWQQQMDSFADRQSLIRAKQFAAANTLAGFQAAITEVNKRGAWEQPLPAAITEVNKRGAWEQPLPAATRNLIAEWEAGLERLVDQPLLDQAVALAQQGDLNAAVATAEKIAADRVLYPEAQEAIAEWIAEQQIAEDQPILEAAKDLAQEEKFSEAIAKAAQIGYGRALYAEARTLIDQWSAELSPIAPAPQPEELDQPEQPASEFEAVDPQPHSVEPREFNPSLPQQVEPEPPRPLEPQPVEVAPEPGEPAIAPAPETPAAEPVPEAPAAEL